MPATNLKIHIPTPLRPYAGGQAAVEVEGNTVGAALASLTRQFPDLKKHLYTDDGRLRAFVNVYVNDEDIRYLEKENTALQAGDSISIVPSIAGGSCADRGTRHGERREEFASERAFTEAALAAEGTHGH